MDQFCRTCGQPVQLGQGGMGGGGANDDEFEDLGEDEPLESNMRQGPRPRPVPAPAQAAGPGPGFDWNTGGAPSRPPNAPPQQARGYPVSPQYQYQPRQGDIAMLPPPSQYHPGAPGMAVPSQPGAAAVPMAVSVTPTKPQVDPFMARDKMMGRLLMFLLGLGGVDCLMALIAQPVVAAGAAEDPTMFTLQYYSLIMCFINLIVAFVIAGLAYIYGARAKDVTSTVESKHLNTALMGIGAILIVPVYEVFGVHRFIPGVTDPGYYAPPWCMLNVALVLFGSVIMVKGVSMIREKRTVYTLYMTSMGIIVLAPLMGTLHYATMGLSNIDYFLMTIVAFACTMFGISMFSRNYLNTQYAQLEAETKMGNDLFDAGRFGEALPHYDNAITIGHHMFSNYFYDPDSGAQARLPPSYGVPWLRKGDALAKMGRGRKALAIYDILLELDPRAEVVWNRKGELLLTMGKLAPAIECFNEAIKIVPTYDKALNNMRQTNEALQGAIRAGQNLTGGVLETGRALVTAQARGVPQPQQYQPGAGPGFGVVPPPNVRPYPQQPQYQPQPPPKYPVRPGWQGR